MWINFDGEGIRKLSGCKRHESDKDFKRGGTTPVRVLFQSYSPAK
jgi:hypothetical protein